MVFFVILHDFLKHFQKLLKICNTLTFSKILSISSIFFTVFLLTKCLNISQNVIFRDPDKTDEKLDTSKDHLVWDWECNDLMTGGDCSYFLDDTTASKPVVDLGAGTWYVFWCISSFEHLNILLICCVISQGIWSSICI